MPATIPLWHVLCFNNPTYEVVCEKSELLMLLVGVPKGKGYPVHEAQIDFWKALNSIPQVFIKTFEGILTCFTNSASMTSCPSVSLGSSNSNLHHVVEAWEVSQRKAKLSKRSTGLASQMLFFIWIPFHLPKYRFSLLWFHVRLPRTSVNASFILRNMQSCPAKQLI